ncbi:MAG TPA: GatB/YqeY domain-containing protein [Candidatus Paceibacterota bacterium]|nr:GatB/YqeY domain-containing protein [Candidatus Pacearchaeota archaeon]HRZ50711.1 GatB/YqeY domain-containing protein [Candidatus Paceibacterota bacterium]HSA36392.1 GatB/YqeY domain-containing protein [Candidatus Paceibacterota bacterium]
MPALKEKIQQDLKAAMIGKQDTVVSVLRLLTAAILNKEKDKQYKLSKETGEAKKPELGDEEILDVIAGELKKMRDALALFEKGGRKDLAAQFEAEMAILKNYLPDQLSEEAVKSLVAEAVEKTGAQSIKDMGKVMAELMPKVRGKADSGLVSSLVKEILAK